MKIMAVAFIYLLTLLNTFHVKSDTHLISSKKISVTIDDLPLNIALKLSAKDMKEITLRLISQVAQQNIPITAFANENKLEEKGIRHSERIEVLKMWRDAGAELGNHTYSHKSAHMVSLNEYKEEIIKGERTVKELMSSIGKPLRFFRHPYLHTGLNIQYKNEVNEFLTERGYTLAPVTIDNQEWMFAAAYAAAFDSNDAVLMEEIGMDYINHMREQLKYFESQSHKLFNRDINHILLIHSNRLNARYFNELCHMLREEGCEFISMEEALRDEAFNSPDTFTADNGISWLHRWAYTQGKQKEFFADEPQVPEYIKRLAGY